MAGLDQLMNPIPNLGSTVESTTFNADLIVKFLRDYAYTKKLPKSVHLTELFKNNDGIVRGVDPCGTGG